MQKTILITLLGTALISISGQLDLSLPLLQTDIPGTWQTFAVLTFAACTNKYIGASAILLYLILGIVGLPVFADGNSGWQTLMGNSGGYLYGFLLGAYAVGLFQEKKWHRNLSMSWLSMLIGTLLILLVGMLHLGYRIGLEKAWQYGVYPFLIGAFIKIILGGIVAYTFYRFVLLKREKP